LSSKDEADAWTEPLGYQLSGEVLQFEADKLVLKLADGTSRTILSRQVTQVDPDWRNDQAGNVHQLFVNKNYAEVIEQVPAVLKTGLPAWQQRALIAELVQAADALGNPRTAGILFLNLAASKPPALLYTDMPLCWTVREPDRALQSEAVKWLSRDDDPARLLGASWLLFGDQRDAAARAITQLQSSEIEAIAQLAVAQSWRIVPPPQTREKLTQWMEYRDKLLSPLQLGPTELLADRLMRIGETQLAIGQWMRIATMHADRYHRAAQALESAATQLQRLGRDEEAKRLEPWVKELRRE
jgi:hypothetical protein